MNGGKIQDVGQRDWHIKKKVIQYRACIAEINEITCKFRSCDSV